MPRRFEKAYVNSPGANLDAVVTLAATSGASHYIWRVDWSYSGAPTGGNLTITDGSATVFELDITAAGPGFVEFPSGRAGTPGAALVVTLNAGGTGVLGKVNVDVVDS